MQRLRVLTALLCPFFLRLRERRVSAERLLARVWRQAWRRKVSAQRVRELQTVRPVPLSPVVRRLRKQWARALMRMPTPLSALVGIRLLTHTRFGERRT